MGKEAADDIATGSEVIDLLICLAKLAARSPRKGERTHRVGAVMVTVVTGMGVVMAVIVGAVMVKVATVGVVAVVVVVMVTVGPCLYFARTRRAYF